MKPILASFTSLAAFGVAWGQAELSPNIPNPSNPEGKWSRPKFNICNVNTAPKIDGVLNDECWKSATRGVGFYRLLSSDPVREQTEIWVCSDNKSLYVSFHCLESKPDSIVTKETQRNGKLDQDDRIVVLIDSQNAQKNASEFWVTANGTQLQKIEGGTADNQAWQGDWEAASQRVATGYVVEVAIPLSLLRYPKGTTSFGMVFGRKKSNETNFTTFPYVPPEGENGSIARFAADFCGIKAPNFAAKPTISPYVLSTAGAGTSARFGLDAKIPLNTAFTGLLTFKPDFQTVEGAVQDLSFSYTEKFVPDRRPFFAEGGEFLDDPFLFYSQRIQDVDFGVKLAGKQGPTSIGLLATTAGIGTKQSSQVANFDHEMGQYSGFGGTFLHSYQGGAAGQVAQVRGRYGWAIGKRNFRFFANATQSSNSGTAQGSSQFFNFNSSGGRGALNVNAYYGSISSTFANPLGLVDDTNTKGGGINLNSFQNYDTGAIEERSTYFGVNTNSRLDGTPFSKSFYAGTSLDFRNGFSLSSEVSAGERETFKDRSLMLGLGWNAKSLLNRGGVSVQVGRRQNQESRFTSLEQGFAIGKKASVNLALGEFRLGSMLQQQAILSGTYRVNTLEAYGGRLVMQGGNSNLYFSYGKRSRTGNDVFVLLGDPNSPNTKRAITVKLVRSL